MKGLNQKLIERYYDGELSPSKAKEVEELVASSPEWRQSFERVARLGDLLRSAGEETASNDSLEGFVESVSERIRLEKKAGVLERSIIWLGEFGRHRKTVWVPSAVAAAAALAVIFAVPQMYSSSAGKANEVLGAREEIWVASGQTVLKSEIESVDFGEASGSIYQLADGSGGNAGVVWIVEGR